ncbi:hypothetical protein ACIQNU_33290 [Streptomyces sp. NPDC091292]
MAESPKPDTIPEPTASPGAPLPYSGCQCGPGCSCGCQSGGPCQCGGGCG